MNLKVNKISIVGSFLLFLALQFSFAQQEPSAFSELSVFYSPSCEKCMKAKHELLPEIEKEFSSKIRIKYYDISDIENYKILLQLREKYSPSLEIDVPVFFLNGKFINGKADLKNKLREFVIESLGFAPVQRVKEQTVDLIRYFKSITPLIIIGAGLVDGINPCAFTVIVFFISFLALQGYRRREMIIIGLAFIFSVFLTYVLIGLGLFGFLYRMQGFWWVTKAINFSIGIFSVGLGFAALYDYSKFKKTGETEGLLLQLPAGIKNQIHKVIGLHYRKTQNHGLAEKNITVVFGSALITGFLVSLLEAVCTGQTYIPTIAFVLRTAHLKLQAFFYLLLYNIMFVVPLLVIFVFALLGVTSSQFSGFLKSRMLTIKMLMSLLFFGLGIFLIWRL
jgi:cytochrome c biogenesis protein CcdA/glutaredoxin